jgi:hypothetical protein
LKKKEERKKRKLLTRLLLLILKENACVTFRYLLKSIHALPTCCAQFQNPELSLRKNSNLSSFLQAQHVAPVWFLFPGKKKKKNQNNKKNSIILLDWEARPKCSVVSLTLSCAGTGRTITVVHSKIFFHVFSSPS